MQPAGTQGAPASELPTSGVDVERLWETPRELPGQTVAVTAENDSASTATERAATPMEPSEPSAVDEVTIEYEPTYEVGFWAETIVPEEGLDERVYDADRETLHVLVQFEDVLNESNLAALEEYRYSETHVLTETTRYAAVPRDSVDAVADLPFVRAVTPIRQEWRIHPDLLKRTAETEATFTVTVLTVDAIEMEGLEPVEENTYVGTITGTQVRELTRNQNVVWVEEWVEPQTYASEGRLLVAAHQAEENPYANAKLNGSGVEVGVLDTGIMHAHPHFSKTTIVDAKDWGDGDSYPEAGGTCSHGTHVAGTIAGEGVDPTRNVTIRGVAPDADLVVSRLFDDDCDWAAKKHYKRNYEQVRDEGAKILSNSWGGDNEGKYDVRASKTDTWAKNNPDTLVVFANGNWPSDNQFIGSPALAKNVISVGAIQDGSSHPNNSAEGNVTAGWIWRTNRNSSLNNLTGTVDMRAGSGRKKPDVYAPGVFVTGPVNNGSYFEMGGTSMAAPHVSGVAAQFRQQYPSSSGNLVKTTLIATTHPPNLDGYGVVDANNAAFDNRYESTQGYVSSSLKKPFKVKKLKRVVQENSHDFQVPSGAEKVVVTLGWADPGHKPFLKGKDTIVVNDLDLYAGPKGDAKRYRVKTQSNVKKLVIDVPPGEDGKTWRTVVRGERITAATSQDYDLVYRVVMDEPTLSVDAPNRIVVPPHDATAGTSAANRTFTVDIEGTGAPVAGIHASVSADSKLTPCSSTDPWIVGTLSDGFESSHELCFQAPKQRGEYPIDIEVKSTNAKGGTITETVVVEVPEATVRLEPFERNVAVGENTTYKLLAENVSGGVGSFRANVSLMNQPIGTWHGVDVPAGHKSVTMDRGSDTMLIHGYGMDTADNGTVLLGVLKAQGTQVGRSNISVLLQDLEDESGDKISYDDPRGSFGTAPPRDGLLLVTEGDPEIEIDTGDPTVGDPIVFNGSDLVSRFDGPVEIEWSFGDGSVGWGDGVTTHTYAEPGTYNVSLTVYGDGTERSASTTVKVRPSDDGSDETTTADVVIDGAPNGLQKYNITIRLPETARIQSVEAGVIGGVGFEVYGGGPAFSYVTVRGVDIEQVVGALDQATPLLTLEIAGDVRESDVAVTVHSLTDDESRPMSTDRIGVQAKNDEVFVEPIPGAGGEGPPTDTDGDGKYDDVNGDGKATFGDAIALAFADTSGLSAQQTAALDFDDDGRVEFTDAISLAFQV
ncbi:MAG: S8 family serine peptidase [Halobacteriota archaeon]